MVAVGAHLSLLRVLDDLGSTLLEVLAGQVATARDITAMAIRDPAEPLAVPAGALVLGVGVHGPLEVPALLGDLGKAGAAALVVHSPLAVGADIKAAADESGVVLLGLSGGALWAQLAAVLQTLLAAPSLAAGDDGSFGGVPANDLFAVANAVAALVDAPVTIEDRSSRVLAFSGRQNEADGARVATILGRQVPEAALAQMEQRNVFRDLYRSTEPVAVAPVELPAGELSMPRVAIAVRAGEEVLGSIWAAVAEPMSQERAHALVEASRLVALHLLRYRAGADVNRRLRADLVSTVLEGGAEAGGALVRLELAGRDCVVLALAGNEPEANDGPRELARLAQHRQRDADALAMHLGAVYPRAVVADVGGRVYGICPASDHGDDSVRNIVRAAADFLRRSRSSANIAVGSVGRDTPGLVQSRVDADRVSRVLIAHGASRQVATIGQVALDALLLELDDRAGVTRHEPSPAIGRIAAHDAAHNSTLLQTLRYWLDAFGDVATAAQRASVHPNTFRYRLRRAAHIGGIDLGDSDQRLAAAVQLRLRGLRSRHPGQVQP